MRRQPLVIRVPPGGCSDELLQPAAQVLRAGGVVAFPTDTVYGLGALADNAAAVARIYEIKGRSEGKPLQVLLADADQALECGEPLSPAAQQLAAAFWPGGLTIVVPRLRDRCAAPARGGPTIGVRVPDCPVTRALIRLAGPLAATSANRAGEPSPRTAREVLASIGPLIDCLVDGGEASLGRESTVVDVSGPRPVLLRAGAIGREELARVLPQVAQGAGGSHSACPEQSRGERSEESGGTRRDPSLRSG